MMTFDQIRKAAFDVGFDACGITSPFIPEETIAFMEHWVGESLPSKLHYLAKNRDKRYDPLLLVPGSKCIVVCLLSYEKCGKDYHRRIKSMLYSLKSELSNFGHSLDLYSEGQHIFCDSAPLLERQLAVQAGLGWIGRNRQLIHPILGAMTHIGELFINEAVEGSLGVISSRCEDCEDCVLACPTGALGRDLWRADRCRAYIDNKCTICQVVCPYNRKE